MTMGILWVLETVDWMVAPRALQKVAQKASRLDKTMVRPMEKTTAQLMDGL